MVTKLAQHIGKQDTVISTLPFTLAALKVGDLACKIILAPFILAN